MSLALSLLTAAPARAQHGPPPTWDITYSQGGSDGFTRSGTPPDSYAWGTTSDQYLMGGSAVWAYAGGSASINGSGTITATLTWNDHGWGIAPPPKIYLAVSASASFGGTATGTADDGQNDPLLGDVSQGTHIEGPFDSSSGAVTYSLPLNCSCSVSVPVGGNTTFLKVGHSMAVAVTDREARIIPTMGTTYHKGIAGLPQANMSDSSGTVTDDTIAPPYNNPRLVQPYGAALGTWGANSGYLWSQLCPGSALSALANPGTASGIVGPSGAIPAYIVTYSRHSDFSSPILSNIHLVVKDGVDSATAAADYFVNFHNEYENFIKLTDVRQFGPWTRVSPDAVSGPAGGPFPLPINISLSVTASVDPSGSAGSAIAAQYGVSVGATYSTAVPRSGSKWQMLPNKHNWIIDQVFWEHMTGTVDNYEGQGYVQQISWSLNKPYNASNPLSDYSEQLVSSDGPPAN